MWFSGARTAPGLPDVGHGAAPQFGGAMPDSDESVVFPRAASQFRQNPTTFDKPRSP